MASIRDLFGEGGFQDIMSGQLLGNVLLGPLGGAIGSISGGQRLFDVIRGKKSRSFETLTEPIQDPNTARGGFFAGAAAGGAAGSGFGPIGTAIGAIGGGVLGARQGRRAGEQIRQQEADTSRIFFEAERATQRERQRSLEQVRTRARFSSQASGSLLTG